jgi:hypothetical protein
MLPMPPNRFGGVEVDGEPVLPVVVEPAPLEVWLLPEDCEVPPEVELSEPVVPELLPVLPPVDEPPLEEPVPLEEDPPDAAPLDVPEPPEEPPSEPPELGVANATATVGANARNPAVTKLDATASRARDIIQQSPPPAANVQYVTPAWPLSVRF